MKFITNLFCVALLLFSAAGFPHERGNGRPRMPAPTRDQQEQQTQQPQQQQQQQQQQQDEVVYVESEDYLDDVWDSMKATDHEKLLAVTEKAVRSEITSEVLIEEFLVQFDESKKPEVIALIETKKIITLEQFASLGLTGENLEVAATAFAIIYAIDDLNG